MRALWDTLLFLLWISAFLGLAWRIAHYRHARVRGMLGHEAYRADGDIPFQIAILLLAAALGLCVYLVNRLVTAVL